MGRISHPSTTQLLNHLMGHPVDDELVAHIEGCPTCRERLGELAEERARFDVFVHPEERLEAFEDRHREERRRGLARLLRWVPAFGVAALLLISVGALFVFDTGTDPGTRLKGSFAVSIYVKRDTEVRQASASFAYRDGDKIRLGIASPVKGFVTVSSLEEGGFVPIPSLRELPVAGGAEIVLPGSLLITCERPAEALRVILEEDIDGDGDPDRVSASEIISFDCEGF